MELDLTKKLFLCFSWENTKEVKEIAADLRHELSADVYVPLNNESADLENEVFPKIEEAEIMIVFISDSSKDSQYVKDCVTYASNLNKRILPVEISKTFFGGSLPQELKFRIKPLSYKSEEQKAKLFSTLKASFGSSVEPGDSYGMLIHIVTDMDASVERYGTVLCKAKVNEDNAIRLTKGTHKLDFIPDEDPSSRYSMTYEVKSNDGEQFIDIPLRTHLKEMEEAAARHEREAEAKRQLEEERLQKQIEFQRRQQENALAQSYAPEKKSSGKSTCGTIAIVLWVVFILFALYIASTL